MAIHRIVGEPDELAGSFKRLPHTAVGWSASVSGFSVILRDRSSAHASYSSIQTCDVANIACPRSFTIYSYHMERRSRFYGACFTAWDSNNKNTSRSGSCAPILWSYLMHYELLWIPYRVVYFAYCGREDIAISLLSDEVLTAVWMPILLFIIRCQQVLASKRS